MTGAYPASWTDGAACGDAGATAGHGLAEWLGLAATPTFVVMALLTGVLSEGPMDGLCVAAHGSPLNGMIPMYLLMGAFHSSLWLKLMSARRRASAGHDRAAAGGAG
jgi:hypothetical protein